MRRETAIREGLNNRKVLNPIEARYHTTRIKVPPHDRLASTPANTSRNGTSETDTSASAAPRLQMRPSVPLQSHYSPNTEAASGLTLSNRPDNRCGSAQRTAADTPLAMRRRPSTSREPPFGFASHGLTAKSDGYIEKDYFGLRRSLPTLHFLDIRPPELRVTGSDVRW